MRYTLKKFLALVMAIMLAVPTFAFAEDAGPVIIEDDGSGAIIGDIESGEIDESLGTLGDLDLDMGLELGLDSGDLTLEGGDMPVQTEDTPETAPEAVPSPAFEQTQEYEGLRFTVRAEAGVVDEGARLSVTRLDEAADISAAAGTVVDGTHHVYGIYLCDAAFEAGLPVVRGRRRAERRGRGQLRLRA